MPETPDPDAETGKVQSGARDEERAEQATAETDEPAAAEQARADADPTAEPPTEDPDEPAQLSDTEAKILGRLGRELGDDIVESASAFGNLVVRVKPEAWRRAAEVSKTELQCDYLSFIAGIDWQPAPREGGEVAGASSAPVQPTETTFGAAGSAGRFQLLAVVESTSHKWGVTLKTDVDEATPRAESWVTVYPGADWHERECWEMYGVTFEGHPSLRHLYLPSEFEGHPLRKDFPLLARQVKPWPGLVDVEPMPGEEEKEEEKEADASEEQGEGGDAS
jgi:NADH-quinone oxidoreductase subunit C